MNRTLLQFIGLLAFIAPPIRSGAVEAISNLGERWPEPNTIGDIQAILPGETHAATFWTGDGSFSVDSVTVEHILFYDPTALRSFQLKLYKNEFKLLLPIALEPPFPNVTVIGELAHPVIDPSPTQWPGTTAYVTYTPVTPIILEPYSLYWVGASEPLDGINEAGLLFGGTGVFTGLCNWQVGVDAWVGYFDEGEQRWVLNYSETLKFKVEATPVGGQLPRCNHPPDVSNARANISTLWPPNGKMVPIHIRGVTDPDGDPVVISIASIEQDEPVTTTDLGTTTPDGAGLGTDTAQVRAERLNNGNGRVYRIKFVAGDGKPNSYSVGQLFVGVPHDQGTHSTAIDDGLINGYYDSRGF